MSAAAPASFGRLVTLLILVFVVVAGSAMLRTSATFDEIVFPAVGARGLARGDFTMVSDHPRVPQYLYGIPASIAAHRMPVETAGAYPRYVYAKTFLWGTGNNPERIILAARLVALALGAALVAATYLLARPALGSGAALLAALLVAFLPDVLAHAGVAYTDLPLTLGLLLSVYALDGAVRRPVASRVALAALACALTACVKYSGLVLGPILLALVALEAASGRWRDAAWRAALLRAIPLFAIVGYVVIAGVYLGDWTLRDFRAGLDEMRSSMSSRPAFLLGERTVGGWWYFFPLALLLKTPVALHVLAAVAAVAAIGAIRVRRWRELAAHSLRAPVVAAALFLAALLASGLNIGVRHALPMLPFLLILVAAGVARIWRLGNRPMRASLAAVAAAYVVSGLSHYPFFLSYTSEIVRGRPLHATLVDSNTDWGQGLVALRDYMRANGIDRVALGYFGSALPEGYGIDYVAMPSFFELPQQPAAAAPRYLVVSATLLAGVYVRGDPYAALRAATPVAIVADTLYVFDLESPTR